MQYLFCILFQNTQTNKENAIIKYYINNIKEKFQHKSKLPEILFLLYYIEEKRRVINQSTAYSKNGQTQKIKITQHNKLNHTNNYTTRKNLNQIFVSYIHQHISDIYKDLFTNHLQARNLFWRHTDHKKSLQNLNFASLYF